jgi:hypothetical protein
MNDAPNTFAPSQKISSQTSFDKKPPQIVAAS